MLSSTQFVVLILIACQLVNCKYLSSDTKRTFKDVFIGNNGGKKLLGTTAGTCWARGGTCVHIRHCPSLNMEVEVPGCTTNFRVCCKTFKPQPPTVGIQRARELNGNFENEYVEETYVVPPVIEIKL